MSWNPRRLVSIVKDWSLTVGEPSYFWLRSDAVGRVLSAVDNAEPDEPTVLYTEALPLESLVIGLESPIPTAHGDAFIIGVPGLEAIRDNKTRQSTQYNNALAAAEANLAGDELPSEVPRSLALFTREGKHFSGGWIHMPDWAPSPKTKKEADEELAELLRVASVKSEVRPLIFGDDIGRITNAVRTAWTLLNTPEERDATETTLKVNLVCGGSREPRDFPVQIVDIRRHTPAGGSGSHGDGKPLDHQYRWQVRGHWRMQPYGPGRTLRRKVWIEAQVRGPEDKPVKPRVNVVRGEDIGNT